MGDLSSLFLFAAALCADSFAAQSSVCGTGKIKIPRSSAWILAFCPAAVLAAASVLGAVLRPLLPEELPVSSSAQSPDAPGLFPFYCQPGICLRTRKKRYKTALCLRLLFSGQWGFPRTTERQRLGAGTGRGLAGCPFLPFPVSQLQPPSAWEPSWAEKAH